MPEHVPVSSLLEEEPVPALTRGCETQGPIIHSVRLIYLSDLNHLFDKNPKRGGDSSQKLRWSPSWPTFSGNPSVRSLTRVGPLGRRGEEGEGGQKENLAREGPRRRPADPWAGPLCSQGPGSCLANSPQTHCSPSPTCHLRPLWSTPHKPLPWPPSSLRLWEAEDLLLAWPP